MRSRKTPAQQQAWSELLLLINDPEWYLDRGKSDRHKTLMKIISADDKDDSSKSKKEKYQDYLNKRPGMEKKIVEMIRQGKTIAQIHEVYTIDRKIFAYVRHKHQLPKFRKLVVPTAEELEKSYKSGGWKKASRDFGASQGTIYQWMRKYGIERNYVINEMED